jgi:hypothetical protein
MARHLVVASLIAMWTGYGSLYRQRQAAEQARQRADTERDIAIADRDATRAELDAKRADQVLSTR